MTIGILGLGKMGSRIAEKLLSEGHDVIVWNRTKSISEEFRVIVQDKKLKGSISLVENIQDFGQVLEMPRVLWMMLPAGQATDFALEEIVKFAQPNDIVIDGGNAFYKDTEKRYRELRIKNIRFLGIGVSGGIIAEINGYPFMAGGDKSAYETIIPLLDSLAKPNGGHAYFGTGGAGHFVKMVHNGIEYGMMQAIGEGFGVLEKSEYNFDLLDVAKVWQKGTIVSSFLIDRAKDALEKNATLSDIVGEIAATGEAEWTINAAKEENVPVPIIEESLAFRRQSKTDMAIQNSFAAKMVAALRREFGGHEVKKR